LGKYIHREAIKNIVPSNILNNPRKLGFLSPLKQIFIDEKYGAVEILTSSKLQRRKLFNPDKLGKILEDHQSLKKNNERILFKVLSTELWFQNFID